MDSIPHIQLKDKTVANGKKIFCNFFFTTDLKTVQRKTKGILLYCFLHHLTLFNEVGIFFLQKATPARREAGLPSPCRGRHKTHSNQTTISNIQEQIKHGGGAR